MKNVSSCGVSSEKVDKEKKTVTFSEIPQLCRVSPPPCLPLQNKKKEETCMDKEMRLFGMTSTPGGGLI